MLLSILIPTTVDRREMTATLIREVQRQINQYAIGNSEVELIVIEDDKQMSIGKKRQMLLERAKGAFVVGIDSDDWIVPDYLDEILSKLRFNPFIDHVGFIEECCIDGKITISIFSILYKKWAEKKDGYDHIRCANPKSVIRTAKALQVGFQDVRFGEDKIFSEAVTPILINETFIPKSLYFYRRNSYDCSHETRYGFDKDKNKLHGISKR